MTTGAGVAVGGGELLAGTRIGGLEAIGAGVGVGPRATVGALGIGLAEASLDDVGEGDTAAADSDAPGGWDVPEPGDDGVVAAGSDGLPEMAAVGTGVAFPPATSGPGLV
ncbi:MAG TPA: hypothetical protein VIM24_00310, partial [Candidatus Limnocylindrales bacterium]